MIRKTFHLYLNILLICFLTIPAFAQTVNYTVTYSYDDTTKLNGIGRLSSVTDGTTTTKYSYDAAGNQIQIDKKIDNTTYTFVNTYDNLNRIRSIKYPDLDVINYSYNGPFLYYVYNSLPSNFYANFLNYNPLGQPGKIGYGDNESTKFTYSNSSNVTCPYDNFRLCTIQTVDNPTPPTKIYQSLTYSYDSVGNILSIKDSDPNNGDQNYVYDDLNRLTSASGLYGTIAFSYDEIGNMTYNSRLSNTNPNYFYPVSGLNSATPHAVIRTGTNTNYNYDPNGNLIAGNGRTFTYNAENRPTTISAVTAGVNSTTNFVYDGYGNRVKKVSPSGVTTTYIGKLYECTNFCMKYILAGDQRIGIKDVQTGDIYYYHPDHLGSSKVITKNGTVSEYLSYYPYGEIRAKPIAAIDVRHKFTGQEYDDETGLYFYGARYYDPALARFISPDNTNRFDNDPQKLNRYSYVLNNPVRYKDQTGKYEKDFHQYMTAYLGYEAGFSYEQARTIGILAQRVDEDAATNPTGLSNLLAFGMRADYHAFIPLGGSMNDVIARGETLYDAAAVGVLTGDLSPTGPYLHFFEDSFVHGGLDYGAFWGHLFAGHGPDYPFMNPQKAFAAEQETFKKLSALAGKMGLQPRTDTLDFSVLSGFNNNQSSNFVDRAQQSLFDNPQSSQDMYQMFPNGAQSSFDSTGLNSHYTGSGSCMLNNTCN